MSVFRQGFVIHRPVEAGMDEITSTVLEKSLRISPGIGFARKLGRYRMPLPGAKTDARERVLGLYSGFKRPGELVILTFPGVHWYFERQLLAQRIHHQIRYYLPRTNGSLMPKEISQALDPWRETPFGGTRIYSVEKEEAIFRAAMHYIPGRRAKDGFKIFNDTAVATTNIQGYQRAEFEELALRHLLPPDLNAAWLDFTGFPTDRRISAIVELWHTTQVDTLTVTFLKARQPRQITALLKDAGGLTKLLLGILADSYLIDDHEYFDGSPMHQVTVRRDPEDCPARVA